MEVAARRDQVEVRLQGRAETAFARGRDQAELPLDQEVGLDLKELGNDLRRVGGRVAKVRKSRFGLIVATLLHEPAGRVRHPEERNAEDDSRQDLNTDGNAPSCLRLAGATAGGNIVVGVESRVSVQDGAGVRDLRGAARTADVRGTIGDPVREQDAERDRELLARDERTTEMGRSELMNANAASVQAAFSSAQDHSPRRCTSERCA